MTLQRLCKILCAKRNAHLSIAACPVSMRMCVYPVHACIYFFLQKGSSIQKSAFKLSRQNRNALVKRSNLSDCKLRIAAGYKNCRVRAFFKHKTNDTPVFLLRFLRNGAGVYDTKERLNVVLGCGIKRSERNRKTFVAEYARRRLRFDLV